MTHHAPSVSEIEAGLGRIAPHIRQTPVWEWQDDLLPGLLGPAASVVLKLELFQHSGTFKARGALMNMLALSPEQSKRGVTAVSAGNHAAAVAYAAHTVGTSAKVVMPNTASPSRVAICRRYGAEVVLADDVAAAFARVKEIESSEGRTFVHPFEGETTVTGTATLGLELTRQVADLDAVVVPIGGGGLIAGVAAAIKQVNPRCLVFGVEPIGNDVIKRSVASGVPEQARNVQTIADSLSPPFALPYSLDLVRRFVDDIVLVSDDDLTAALYLLFARAKLAVEPAGAATTAAMLGPLRSRLTGQRIGLIVCGANIDPARFADYLIRGERCWLERS